MHPVPRTLLQGAIDYAGFFPPASLSMQEVVNRFAAYHAGADAWALGRLVMPAARLDECAACAASYGVPHAPWRISAVVAGPGPLAGLADFNEAHVGRFVADAAEGPARAPAEVDALVAALPPGIELFVELAVDDQLEASLARVKAGGVSAKIRLGGVVRDAFPSADAVVRFMRACHGAQVRFKATAGLHHPLRGDYRLTYDAASPHGPMFGYMNVMLAAGAVAAGAPDDEVRLILLADAVDRRADRLTLAGREFSTPGAASARQIVPAFGSCSFREPLDDLVPLGLA